MFKKRKETGPVINEFADRHNLPTKSSPELAFDEVAEEEKWPERKAPEGFIPIEDIPDDFDEDKILEEIDKSMEKEEKIDYSIVDLALERTIRSIELLKKYGEKEVTDEQKKKIFFNHVENLRKEFERLEQMEDELDEVA